MRIFVTGGAGFIGSTVIRQYLAETDAEVINVDKLTYAGSLESLSTVRDHPRYRFEATDICDRQALDRLFKQYKPDAVMNLAAETHVDRSITDPAPFIQTNIVGTYTLLEAARSYLDSVQPSDKALFRFHHISTDEVFGDLSADEKPFCENAPYAPSSPYSASKASSDHLARAWHRTYGLPVIVSNCSNNFGPFQFPEKLIPRMILNALEGAELPIYGRGDNIRDWLFVEDHARALRCILAKGRVGQTYNIGGKTEKTNLEVVRHICLCLDKLVPLVGSGYDSLIRFVTDRPGHDRRYAIDDSRITTELGWQPEETFESGIEKTTRWYLDNSQWLRQVLRNPQSDRSHKQDSQHYGEAL